MVNKIFAICGPPHSGKSVLLRSLYRIGGFYVVPVQPDGEGFGWTTFTESEVVSKIRVKGDFNNQDVWKAYIDHARNLRNNLHLLKEIPLLDMGGRPTNEKKQILKESKAHVVLVIRSDKFLESKKEWESLASDTNSTIVAIIKTTLHGKSQISSISPTFIATLSGLIRGNEHMVSKDPVVRELASFLKKLAINDQQPPQHEKFLRIKIEVLESILGIPLDPNHLGGRKWWQPVHLKRLYHTAYKIAQNNLGKDVLISGPAPVFVVVTLVHALHGVKDIFLEDSKIKEGYVKIRPLPLSNRPKGPFKLEKLNGLDLLFLNPDAEVLDVKDIPDWRLPKPHQPVVLWGRAPLWLYAISAESVAHIVPWVGVGQPHLLENKPGFTISISHESQNKLGKTYPLNI